MLAREGDKDEDFEKSLRFFFFLSSQVELKEMSFQLLLEKFRSLIRKVMTIKQGRLLERCYYFMWMDLKGFYQISISCPFI